MIGIRHQRHYGSTPLIILKGDEHGDEQAKVKKNRKKLNIKVIKEKTKKRNRGKEKRKLPPLFI